MHHDPFCFRTGYIKCLGGIRVILEPACIHQSIEHTASAVPVAFWLVLPFREGRILYGLKTYDCVVYLQIFNTKNYILFKTSASGLFLKHS